MRCNSLQDKPNMLKSLCLLSTALLVSAALLAATGCKNDNLDAGAPKQKELPVAVAKPVAAEITGFEEFTGRTKATGSVDVRSRVTGYLKDVQFEEGAVVTKDKSKLFLIDPETFQAEVDRVDAEVARAE